MPILKIQSAPEWIEYAKTLPDPKMLFDEFWCEGEMALLFSDTNVGKSIVTFGLAQSIASGTPFGKLKIQTPPQKVLLGEFELNTKQFEARFKDKDTGEYFNPSNNIMRAVYDFSTDYDEKTKLDEIVLKEIEKYLVETGIKVVIIDNITAIQDTGKFDQAISFMRRMNFLKFKLNLSILVVAHTPKRKLTEPLDENSMAGSKALMNLADVSFVIGRSSKGEKDRYLKQIKIRSAASKYKSEVLDCKIIVKSGFLTLEFLGQSPESSHLEAIDYNEVRNNNIKEDYNSGKYTQIQLGEKYSLSREQVNRILKKPIIIEDDVPF